MTIQKLARTINLRNNRLDDRSVYQRVCTCRQSDSMITVKLGHWFYYDTLNMSTWM